MRLDDAVTVDCTDTDKSMPGKIVRMRGDWIDVAVGQLMISLRKTKPGLWVGNQSGMEFVVRT